MTARTSFGYRSVEDVKSIINTTLIDLAFDKYREKTLINRLKQTQQPRAVIYTDSLIHQMMHNELLQSSNRTALIEQACPNPKLDEVKAKMVRLNGLRNSSITFRNHSIDSFHRTYRFKDTFLDNQLNDSDIHRSVLRTTTNRSSEYAENRSETGGKVYRHEKTYTQINQNPIKNNKKSPGIFPLVDYQKFVKNENSEKQQVLLNRQIDRQIQFIRSRKLKLQAAFSSFNYSGNRKTYFGEQMDETTNVSEKQPQHEKKEQKNRKNSESQLRVIITDYDGQIIAPIKSQKLKKINPKNKENLTKYSFMPIVRVNTEVTTNQQDLLENKRSFITQKAFIKHQDSMSKQSSTAKESKDSDKKLKQKFSLYNADDDWTTNHSSLNNKIEEEKKFLNKKLNVTEESRKKRRIIEKGSKSQKNLS